VQAAVPTALSVPEMMDLGGEALAVTLPAHTVAVVNGKRQRGTLSIKPKALGQVFVDIRGAEHGNFVVRVGDYADRRRAAYPPAADQLDTIFHDGIDAWRAQIQAVKDAHPKR